MIPGRRSGLSSEWVRWRRRRYQRLAGSGLAGHLAWPIAAAEANWRSRLGSIIGRQRAQEAQIACLGRAAELRFVLTGTIAGLNDEQVQSLAELSRTAANTAS